jgi:hypothetical protein
VCVIRAKRSTYGSKEIEVDRFLQPRYPEQTRRFPSDGQRDS